MMREVSHVCDMKQFIETGLNRLLLKLFKKNSLKCLISLYIVGWVIILTISHTTMLNYHVSC